MPKRYCADVDRDAVEHDRRDHLVRSAVGLEPARDARPDRAADARRRWSPRPCRPPPPTYWATSSAHTDPTQNWPVPPMLKRPQRNANATAKPVRTSGVNCTSVEIRLVSASSASTPNGLPGMQVERPVEAGADPELLVDVERVGARERHREPAHDQRQEDGQQREAELARATATPEPRDHAGTSPPVMARPSSCSSVCPLARSSTIWPVVQDEDAVGEVEDLVQLERHEQDGAARVALLDQAAVHELDGADVEAARGLRGDHQARVGVDLARQDELLLVAARERARGRRGAAAAHVVGLDPLGRARGHGVAVEPAAARDRLLVVVVQGACSRPARSRARARGAGGPRGCARRRRRTTRAGSRAVTSTPLRSMRPTCGTRMPAIASTSSVWPLPSTPAMPTISPARTASERPRTASRPRSSRTHRSLHREHRLAGVRRRPRDVEQHLAADHQLGEAALARALAVDRRDLLAAPQHRDAVGDLEHLVQLVRDQDDRRAAARRARAARRTARRPPAGSAPRSARRGSARARRGRAP